MMCGDQTRLKPGANCHFAHAWIAVVSENCLLSFAQCTLVQIGIILFIKSVLIKKMFKCAKIVIKSQRSFLIFESFQFYWNLILILAKIKIFKATEFRTCTFISTLKVIVWNIPWWIKVESSAFFCFSLVSGLIFENCYFIGLAKFDKSRIFLDVLSITGL